MPEHTFLVGISSEGETREAAELALSGVLVPLLQSRDSSSPVESWWIAEDERHDGSDLDSAVFVIPGQQAEAQLLLARAGLAHAPEGTELAPIDAWVVETIYNTDPEGNWVEMDDYSNRTLHGPFPGRQAADHFMTDVWPDGDTDVKEMEALFVNPPEGMTVAWGGEAKLRLARQQLITRAALAFLHGQDPESLDLAELADALGEPRADVEALAAWDDRSVPCPRCGAKVGESCHKIGDPTRPVDAHAPRWQQDPSWKRLTSS